MSTNSCRSMNRRSLGQLMVAILLPCLLCLQACHPLASASQRVIMILFLYRSLPLSLPLLSTLILEQPPFLPVVLQTFLHRGSHLELARLTSLKPLSVATFLTQMAAIFQWTAPNSLLALVRSAKSKKCESHLGALRMKFGCKVGVNTQTLCFVGFDVWIQCDAHFLTPMFLKCSLSGSLSNFI